MRALDQRARAVLLLHDRVVAHFARGVGRQRQSLYACGLGITVVFPAMALRLRGCKIRARLPAHVQRVLRDVHFRISAAFSKVFV